MTGFTSGSCSRSGGRTLKTDKSVAKYVNSKESEIYVKSRSLYGIYFAKNEMAKMDKVYLVEGYLDVLSMHQLGILNTVASSGTSLTVEQIRLMKRFTPNVTIMYDGDSAGIHAALRGINMVLKEDMNVKIVLLPDGDDPDSFARKHTLAEVQEFIAENERDFIGFKTDLLLEDAGRDPLKKAMVINDIADTIAGIPDAIKRSVYVGDCAQKFGIESDILFDRIRKTREKDLEERRAEASRAADRPAETDPSSEAPLPEVEKAPAPVSPQEAVRIEEDPVVAPSEQELLSFILRDGTTPLDFPSDSEFYAGEEPQTVADFIDAALDAGYTVAWGGDVTGDFTRTGTAELPDSIRPSQALRQEQWDDWRFTYDHVMLIYGKAVDEHGRPYYMVKNTWGKVGLYKGIWYMSRDYMTLNTTYIFLNRRALPKPLRRAVQYYP